MSPTVGGYILGGVLAVVLGSVMIAGVFTTWNQVEFTVSDFLATVAFVGVPVLAAALILGAPLTVAAHYRLRRVHSRWIRVAVFGVVGAVVATVVIGLVFPFAWPAGIVALLIAAAALSSALGRLAIRDHRPFVMPTE